MAIEDAILQAIMSGCLTLQNCQIVFGGHAQMGEFQQNAKSASTENHGQEVDPKLKSDKAHEIWRALVKNKYCHAQGSTYVWDATQVEYGYMVYIVSDILDFKHPSSGRILWKEFKAIFPHDDSFEKGAQVAVSKNLAGLPSYKAWPNEAKNIRNIFA